jgi:hypothetical protein
VAADATDIGAVAAIASDVSAVSTIAADVSAVAAIDSDITTAATNVADITNFADVYQGAKASDPVTRNDTTALQAGDLYFNTNVDVMKVYTGGVWETAYVPTSGYIATGDIGTTVQAYDADIPTVAASQAEMEAGTEASLRSMSPANVKQAIDARGGGGVTFASSAENAAGTVENKAVDPLGIREAFNATGTAPVYACRAWVNFNGTTSPITIRGSGNVSSITDDGVGLYTVNFATALEDSNYAVTCTNGQGATQTVLNFAVATPGTSSLSAPSLKSTTAVQVRNRSSSGTAGDPEEANVVIFR